MPSPKLSLSPARRVQITPEILAAFEAAARGKPRSDFLRRNRLILQLWGAGDSIHKVCTITETTPSLVWRVLRYALAKNWDRLVAKGRAGPKGKRAAIIEKISAGATPQEIPEQLGVHKTTVWRACQQLKHLPKSA